MKIYKLPSCAVQPAAARARARAEANAAWLGWLAARAVTTPRDIPGVGIGLYLSEAYLIQRAVRQARRAIGWRRVGA